MDTSPNSTSNADIKRKLDEKIDYHLFGVHELADG